MWPRRIAETGDEDEDENELESFNNRRLMRLGAFFESFFESEVQSPIHRLVIPFLR